MSSATRNEELRPGDSLGGWRILAHLASGGMGSVYAARNEITGATRALKVIKDDLLGSDDIRARFVREVSLASRIKHPNVVAAFDPLVVEGRVVLPMELLEGETLAQRLSRGPLAFDEAIGLGITLAGALASFHAQGIIHRDLKPGNVFLAKDPSGAVVPKILDLGAARELEGSKHTQTGHTVGSPSYMAPEQARADRDLDARVDVYALGVLLYVMLTCRRPIESDERGSAIAKLVQGSEILPPRAHRPDVPAALEEVVLTAMARERSARFASADALAAALEGVRSAPRDRPRDATVATPREIPTTRPGMMAWAPAPGAPAPEVADARREPTTRTPSLALLLALGASAFGIVVVLGLGWALRASLVPALADDSPRSMPPPSTPPPSMPPPAMPPQPMTAPATLTPPPPTPLEVPPPEAQAVTTAEAASDARAEDAVPDAGAAHARRGHGARPSGGGVPRGAGLWLDDEGTDDQK